MEDDHDHDIHELRFVCKLCDKKYPSGKSLGGHMRSHAIAATANSSESDEKFSSFFINGNGIDNGSPSSYGLRENPKKTWRAVVGGGVGGGSSTFSYPNEKICKQCGKGFQSLKALCGHMACHSEKDRNLKDYDHSWTSENLDHEDDKLIIDSHSDTEELEPEFQDPTRVTRSKSKRYKKVVIKPFSFSFSSYNNNNCNNSNNNSSYNYGSSSVSETDDLEDEQVAICLMMLSKDSTNWAGVDSVVESSDNNSAVLETKSSSKDSFQLENSHSLSHSHTHTHSGYLTRKVESDVSVEELLRNGDPNKKSKRVFDKTRELSYEEKLEIRRNLFKEFEHRGSLKKRARDDDDAYNPEHDREGPSKQRRNKYECLNCNKIFNSFQGLGGHRPCHKKNNIARVKNDSDENSLDGEFARARKPKYDHKKLKTKKNKGHECPICFRMFKSGQALGGHKRSHFINGSMDHFAPMEFGAPSSSDMIDLNLPAPEEDQN